MIFNYRNLVFIFSVLFFSACSEREFVYRAQPVDIKVTEKNGTCQVEGSSVFQLPDTFVWGGSPIQIDDKYYLFFSAWESGPEVPPFSQSWLLNSKIGVAVSSLPYGNFKSLGIFLKKELLLKDGTTLKVDRLERPQLLLDENDDPVVLFAACSIDPCNNKQDGGTFNVQIPIKKVKK